MLLSPRLYYFFLRYCFILRDFYHGNVLLIFHQFHMRHEIKQEVERAGNECIMFYCRQRVSARRKIPSFGGYIKAIIHNRAETLKA